LLFSILLRRPIKSITIPFKEYDFAVEVKIADIFQEQGAIVISSNSKFESDVAGGKISVNSLQGQFTAKYYTGNQTGLEESIADELNEIEGSQPYSMGTTVPIHTHGKTFYFVAMAHLGENGNASTTLSDINQALSGLWNYVRDNGELQELVIPVLGTGRGRLEVSRKKMIARIVESFVKESKVNKFSEKLVITIRPKDAENFGINLYEIKDHLNHVLS